MGCYIFKQSYLCDDLFLREIYCHIEHFVLTEACVTNGDAIHGYDKVELSDSVITMKTKDSTAVIIILTT